MNAAHGGALAAALALLAGALWHLSRGGEELRFTALPDRETAFSTPGVALQAAEVVQRSVPTDEAGAVSGPMDPPVAGSVERTSVSRDPVHSEVEALLAEAQLDLGLRNPGALPVATDRSSLARDWAPSLAAELGWVLPEAQLQLLGTWLAGHERRERRLLEAERGQPEAADQARDDLRSWLQSFDALFGAERGLALRRRLEQR